MQPYLASPREALTEAQVLAAISNPSPQVRHGVTVLDSDLQETGETLPVDWDTGGEVTWSFRPSDPGARATDTVEVRRTATLPLAGDVADDLLLSRLHRVWTKLRSTDGTWVQFNLGTFVAALPPVDDDGTVIRRQVSLAPREHLFASRTLDDAVTVTAAEDVLDHIKADLSTVFGITTTAFPTPSGASTLGEDYYFPTGTSYAEKWRRMLAGIAYDQVVTTVDGLPTALQLDSIASKGPEWTYQPGGRVVVAGGVQPGDPELPNAIRYEARNGPSLGATLGNGLVIVKNQSDGPASIDQRGFEVWRTVQADAVDQDELEAFAAVDAQRLFAGGGLRWTGRVGLNPLHGERDVIGLVRPRIGLSGTWAVTSWRYPLRRITGPDAALMDLTAEYRVSPTVEVS